MVWYNIDNVKLMLILRCSNIVYQIKWTLPGNLHKFAFEPFADDGVDEFDNLDNVEVDFEGDGEITVRVCVNDVRVDGVRVYFDGNDGDKIACTTDVAFMLEVFLSKWYKISLDKCSKLSFEYPNIWIEGFQFLKTRVINTIVNMIINEAKTTFLLALYILCYIL